jgi:hypothetical protein
MTTRLGTLRVAGLAAALLVAGAAHAQDTAAAEALFDKGVTEMEAGRYAAGCPALEESHRLEPKPGTVRAAGIVAGSVTGAMVLGKKGTVSDNCVGAACSAEGKSAADSGKSLATASTVCFGVGLAGAAAAVVLLVTEPKADAARAAWRPVVGADGASGWVGARGSW